jgi:uncharacterized protein (DUF427 family)
MAKRSQIPKTHFGCWKPIILQVTSLPSDKSQSNSNQFPNQAYYLPTSSLSIPVTPTKKSTFCEWKGWATYYSITLPAVEGRREEIIKDRIWSYESPTKGYKDIKGYVSFYAGPWDCYVDGELVKPQPGDFYGGWTTSELEGTIKGDAATRWL